MSKMILGIGSQSAGTLLIYSLLDQCKDIAMHSIAELHYFDTLYIARDKLLLQEFSQNQFNYENIKFFNEYNQIFFNLRHEALPTEKVEDIDYFSLSEPMSEELELLGEVTLEYILLDDDKIEKMSNIIGKESKIIFMVLHSVDRFLASLKILLPSKYFNQNQRDFEKNLLSIIQEHPKCLEVQDRFNHYAVVYWQYKKVDKKTSFECKNNIIQKGDRDCA